MTVSIPWNKVRWLDIGLIKPNDVHFTVTWRMMIDDAFTVNDTFLLVPTSSPNRREEIDR